MKFITRWHHATLSVDAEFDFTENHLFKISQRVNAIAQFGVVGHRVALRAAVEADQVVGTRACKSRRVCASATVNCVVALAAVHRVVASTSKHCVVACSCLKIVIAFVTAQLVAELGTAHAFNSNQRVYAAAGVSLASGQIDADTGQFR